MGRKSGYIIAIGLGMLVVAALFMPQIRQFWHNLRAEGVEVPLAAGNATASPGETLNLEIITILGKDGIPAILDPQFLSGAEASEQMVDSERVLGVSIRWAGPLSQITTRGPGCFFLAAVKRRWRSRHCCCRLFPWLPPPQPPSKLPSSSRPSLPTEDW